MYKTAKIINVNIIQAYHGLLERTSVDTANMTDQQLTTSTLKSNIPISVSVVEAPTEKWEFFCHQSLSSTMYSNDDIDWPVHPLFRAV